MYTTLMNSKLSLIILLVCTLLVLPLSVLASSVTGRYLKGSGTTITLQVSVGKPAPSSIIVEQSISPKNKIKNAKPKPQKIGSNGKVKWLVKNIRPGKRQFTLKLSAPLQGSVRGVIRYKDPASGKFLESAIAP